VHKVGVFARDDTFFGVCQALGEDFGFHSNIPRVLIAVGLFVNPVAAIAAYAVCGALVAVSRWLVPDVAPDLSEANVSVDDQSQAWEELALAA
jgi:phage shock protein C